MLGWLRLTFGNKITENQPLWSGSECVCTRVVAAALCDAVTVHLAEVSGVEADADRMQQHAAETSQSALWWYAEVARRMALQTRRRHVNHHTHSHLTDGT